jgi:hypothetical protein
MCTAFDRLYKQHRRDQYGGGINETVHEITVAREVANFTICDEQTTVRRIRTENRSLFAFVQEHR